MRLDDFKPGNIRVNDQRGRGGGLPFGGGGKLGCGGLLVVLIGSLVFGLDPMQLMNTVEQVQGPADSQVQSGSTLEESCNTDELSREACNTLSSLNATWQPLFEKANIPFKQPTLNFYSQAGRSGCGMAQSAMGPFYCPPDQGIYIDTDFYREMEQKLGAGGDFARMYVMAHEYGHHMQNLLGMADQVRQMQQRNPSQANSLSVRMELQADCYAGVWAGRNRDRIEAGDMEEGMTAANAIGDDALMRKSGQRISPESFTHGTSEQRMKWLRRGMETSDEDQCDTFADLRR